MLSKLADLSRVVALLLLVATSVCRAIPVTQAGVQCPTAPVQAVKVAVKDCCNHVVVKVEAPKPGSRFFVQCRCGEKKSAHQAAVANPRLEFYVAVNPVFSVPEALTVAGERYQLKQKVSSRRDAPSLRPPTSV